MNTFRRLVWVIEHPAAGVYGTPVVLAAGFYFAATGPEWWSDFFLGPGLGLLISFWIGSGFAFMWWMLSREAGTLPGGEPAAGIIGIAALFLVGGVSLFAEPWLFGVAIWPGVTLMLPAVERWLARRDGNDDIAGDDA